MQQIHQLHSGNGHWATASKGRWKAETNNKKCIFIGNAYIKRGGRGEDMCDWSVEIWFTTQQKEIRSKKTNFAIKNFKVFES